MQRWLSLELTKKLGVLANVRFLFPDEWMEELFKALGVHSELRSSEFELGFYLFEHLPHWLEQEPKLDILAPLRQYLQNEDLKNLQLCGKIAEVFDRYTVHRPQMLEQWEQQTPQDWQAWLWEKLNQNQALGHLKKLKEQAMQALSNKNLQPELSKNAPSPMFENSVGFPNRLALFGMAYLSKHHLDLLAKLSQQLDVHCFLLTPCQEYWADLVSPTTQLRHPGQSHQTVHPLLAAWGSLGKNFFHSLLKLDLTQDFGQQFFCEPPNLTMLNQLQRSILTLEAPQKQRLAVEDDSIQIHACHNPKRELEALRETILHRLNTDPDLELQDILVMVNGLEVYAPLIHAVFEQPTPNGEKLFYSIADLNMADLSPNLQALRGLCQIIVGRFTLLEVLDWLKSPLVQTHFNLQTEDVQCVEQWLVQAQTRWGLDAEHKQDLGLPPNTMNSWQHGIERLLMGWAMGDVKTLFAGIAPQPDLEGQETQVFGQFLEFFAALKATVEKSEAYPQLYSKSARSFADWVDYLTTLKNTFFGLWDSSEERLFAKTCQLFKTLEQKKLCQKPVNFELMIETFWQFIQKDLDNRGFLGGGITFCSLLPLRSVPFKMLAMLGLNSQNFPRTGTATSFDKLQDQPQPLDPSTADEDRYLMLESLLSVKECWYLSYLGFGQHGSAILPPSTLITELLDYLQQNFVAEAPAGLNTEADAIQQQLLTKHKLQSFDLWYYQQGRPSYAEENHQAAAALAQNRLEKPIWLTRLPAATPAVVSVADWVSFFKNPCQSLLQGRLKIKLHQPFKPLEHQEPFAVHGLDAYSIKQELLADLLEQQDYSARLEYYKASGQVPAGQVGEIFANKMLQDTQQIYEQLDQLGCVGSTLEDQALDVVLKGIKITGSVKLMNSKTYVYYRCARIKGKDWLTAGLNHFLLALQRKDCSTYLVLLDDKKAAKVWRLAPPEDPQTTLEQWLQLYQLGQQKPLAFFPESALKYCQVLKQVLKKGHASAAEAALKVFEGTQDSRSDAPPGEKDQSLYFQKVFANQDIAETDFFELAQQVFKPILDLVTTD